MGTECSYDYVFVYDGDSFRSPLLGSFSGKTEPQQVTSSSGYVRIYATTLTMWIIMLEIQVFITLSTSLINFMLHEVNIKIII